MRSRLEADFARWLDGPGGDGLLGGASWLYEGECFADEYGQYLPDFVSRDHPDGPLFLELKPASLLTLPGHDPLVVLDGMRPIFASVPDAMTVVVYREHGDELLRDLYFAYGESVPEAWWLPPVSDETVEASPERIR